MRFRVIVAIVRFTLQVESFQDKESYKSENIEKAILFVFVLDRGSFLMSIKPIPANENGYGSE